jgi:hypothetical protein
MATNSNTTSIGKLLVLKKDSILRKKVEPEISQDDLLAQIMATKAQWTQLKPKEEEQEDDDNESVCSHCPSECSDCDCEQCEECGGCLGSNCNECSCENDFYEVNGEIRSCRKEDRVCACKWDEDETCEKCKGE